MSRPTEQRLQRRADDVVIRRPGIEDWPAILKVLKTANFHAIGSSEMPRFPLTDCFVADVHGRVVGVGGYRILDRDCARTTLLAVDPNLRGRSIGERLQRTRLDFMKASGARAIYTNADDERVIEWLIRKYGYRRTGRTIPKTCSFGKPDVTHWTNLVLYLSPKESHD